MKLPDKLLKQLQGVAGFDEPAFVAAHAMPSHTSVRINPDKDMGLFADSVPVPWCHNGVYLPARPVFTLDPAYHAGAYYVQEASSMFLEQLLTTVFADRRGLRVLDLCAAPGGKSTHIASLLPADGLLISNDVIRTRASILDENMTRWGNTDTWVTSNDPRDFAQMLGYFDVIVVDAPCSGSGLFRKDAAAINEWSEDNVRLCSERQQRILADIWPALKEDGVLVYATCSYSRQEDEDVLDWLHDTFDILPVAPAELNDKWGITVTESASGLKGYRFFPDKVNGEGFFISAVRKTEGADTMKPQRFRTVHDKKVAEQSAYLLRESDRFIIAPTGKGEYSALHTCHEGDWQIVNQLLYLRKAGVNLGAPAGKDWIPAHDVALSIDMSDKLACMDVSSDQALHYLKREDIGTAGLPKGWLVVKYNGLGLGWIKSLGNRVNNYLPKHWRIRMELPNGG